MTEIFFYSERSDYYDELFKVSPWKRLYLQKTSALIKKYLPSRSCRVLDAGGGTGLLSLPLALLGCHVTVVDSSSRMLAVLNEKVEALSLKDRVTVIHDDIARVANFAPGAFDYAICCQVMNFLGDDAERIIAELGSVTKGPVVADADTRYFWTMMEVLKGHPGNALKIALEGRDEVGRAVGGAAYRLFEPEEIKSLLLDNRMSIELIRPFGHFAGFLHAISESKGFLNENSLPQQLRKYTRESVYGDLLKLEEKFSDDERFSHSTQWVQFVYRGRNS